MPRRQPPVSHSGYLNASGSYSNSAANHGYTYRTRATTSSSTDSAATSTAQPYPSSQQSVARPTQPVASVAYAQYAQQTVAGMAGMALDPNASRRGQYPANPATAPASGLTDAPQRRDWARPGAGGRGDLPPTGFQHPEASRNMQKMISGTSGEYEVFDSRK